MSFWCPIVILAKAVKGQEIFGSTDRLYFQKILNGSHLKPHNTGGQVLRLPSSNFLPTCSQPNLGLATPSERVVICWQWRVCVVSTLPERTPTASLLPQSFFWCTGLKQPRAVAWQSLPNPGQAVLGSCSQVGELILGDFQLLHLSAQAAWTGQAAAAKNQSQDFVNNLMKVLGALVPAVANLWAGQTVAHTSTASQKKTRSQVGIFFWSPSQK